MEIADLQCPFCAQYSAEALPTIVRDYVRTGKLDYELHFRSFLGRDSVRAAGAAAEAANAEPACTSSPTSSTATRARRTAATRTTTSSAGSRARSRASTSSQVVAAADDPLAQPAVRRAEQFARDLGSTGTPDFYIRKGGRLTPLTPQGTAPEDYAAALDAALAAQ